MKKFFVYRGIRIRKFHMHVYGMYQFLMMIPIFCACGLYTYVIFLPSFQKMENTNVMDIVFSCVPMSLILLFGYLLVYFLTRISYIRNGFFNRVRERQNLAKMIVANNFYTTKKKTVSSGKGSRTTEKMKFPKIYYRNKKNFVSIFFPMDGNKHQEKYMKMGTFLEDMFLADNMGVVNHKGFVEYRLLSNVQGSRIKVNEMKADKNGVLLMRNVWWNFNSLPHLLIGGGTGGGKTFTMMSLILALLPIAEIEICDPKDIDLAQLSNLPAFKGKVFTGKAILGCLRRGVDEMVRRYKFMKESPKFKMGKNYAYYGIPPKFIFLDEWAAFITELESMEDGYKLVQEANGYMTQLILKARQAGLFIVLGMQRPDGQYLPTALRDNFMFRMSVGTLSETGYDMIFGDVNKDKNFKVKKVKGHGYLAEGGTSAQEFYSAFVPEEFDFAEEFAKFPEQISFDLSGMQVSDSERNEILEEMENEPIAV